MRFLITGGGGYLGSVLCQYIIRFHKDHSIMVVDNRPAMTFDVEYIYADVRDTYRVVQPLMRRADVIIPMAAIVGAPSCDELRMDATTTNTYAITDMLSRLSKDQKVIFPATDSGYPQGKVDEETPMCPKSHYARTKYAAECAVLHHGGVALRLASVFGMSPRMRTDLIVNNFVLHAVNRKHLDVYEGKFLRNFIHIRDVARAFLHAVGLPCGAYNVANPICTMTKHDLCRLISRSCPWFEYREIEGKADPDRRDCVVSTDKISATGWEPHYDFSHGINDLIEGYISSARATV